MRINLGKILKNEKTYLIILAVLCSLFLFFKLGSYKLIDVDEPRYAEAAREMLEKRDWITPYFNYELRFDKPIFFYWLIAISYLVMGVSELAARMPSAIVSVLTVLFTYYFGKKAVSPFFGFISGIILLTSLEFIAIGRMSITDMTLAFFIASTVMAGYLGSTSDEKNRKYWWWFAYILSGFAVLTKGPVGFILPAAIFGVYFILIGKLKDNLKLQYLLPGIALFGAISIPWYYLIIKEHGMKFVNYFFLKHNLERFASKEFGQHEQPIYFYCFVVLLGFFPWSISFIFSFINKIKLFVQKLKKNTLKSTTFTLAVCENWNMSAKFQLFNALWFSIVFVFFSLSGAKLLTYILPLFPAMALISAVSWYDYLLSRNKSTPILVSVIFTSLIALLVPFVALFGLNYVLPSEVKVTLDYSLPIFPLIIMALLGVALIYVYIRKLKVLVFATIVAIMANITFIAVNNVLPIVYKSGQKELISYVNFAKKTSIPEEQFICYSLVKPSVVFYAKHKILFTEDSNILNNSLTNDKPVIVVIKNRDLVKISPKTKYSILNKGIKYDLISNKKLKYSSEEE